MLPPSAPSGTQVTPLAVREYSIMTQQRFKGQKNAYMRPSTSLRTIPRRPKILPKSPAKLADLASCTWSPDGGRSVVNEAKKKNPYSREWGHCCIDAVEQVTESVRNI